MPPVQDKPDVARLQQEALALAAKPTKSFHAFARALWAAHSNDPTFLYEVERVAGVKRRALFYLSSVGGFLADYSITEEQAERIGWTKIQIVARHIPNQPERINQRAMQDKLGIAARSCSDDPEKARGGSGLRSHDLLRPLPPGWVRD